MHYSQVHHKQSKTERCFDFKIRQNNCLNFFFCMRIEIQAFSRFFALCVDNSIWHLKFLAKFLPIEPMIVLALSSELSNSCQV